MISAGDLRKGVTFEFDGQVFTVTDFLHVKPGKGAAFVRTKLRNVISGGVVDRTFNPTEKLQEAVIERKEMQYLYSDGELYYFMDQETFEQIPLNAEKVEDAIKYLKENMFAVIKFFKGSAFSVEAPNFVELQITYTEPGVKGNTATNSLKPATVETGAIINVPMFVNDGDVIRIDTRTGEYMERV
ncbi:elongation factor P [Clostridium botulinum]|uniref:Elongation factor P n=3 Tax=Clostridium botulinum TaxID=1491 RepID=EFP_CLOBB|nr:MULTISPECIES: elongation factor P [Clostridium]B2TRQ5.1 RecName: Full=Elongation factor P; Short=EF-P [Clostridium botulinum B str. Eklund 17B (NRP)]B2V4S9.1 RecName: Full=Elongation factor P; Short=EF-P [Clostridium botulinum E3 str. Alaska E43]AIY80417.1 translation elongation factor P [Clostridium botulinum 202F]ACD24198.1 translation elongation factor P [Clostridium botulinum B str. Eklund 17B (NRP)]ACD52850.1 translation elongation factor P [Clostridium botulinum E3 str. Alaska E43]AJ